MTPGERLGPYEILALLGAGGMGEVYKARDTRLDRVIALKVLSPDVRQHPDRQARFEREAKAISQLNHPHICTLHDVGRDGDIVYLVMELVEGESLAARLARRSHAASSDARLPLVDVLDVGRQLAEALEAAHRLGIVHRDLKPGNVMLTKSGAKLLDFGLAKLRPARPVGGESVPTKSANVTAEGTLLGTMPYMAPEQLEGKDVDARADIWALGCVLYEMAAGRRAFEGKSQASLIGAIMNTEPPALATLQPLTPPGLDHVVRTCLAKDPDERWQSAADVKRELRWIADEQRVAVPPASGVAEGAAVAAPATTRRWPWRRSLLWLTVASVVAIGAVASTGWVPWTTTSHAVPVVTRSSIRVAPAERVESVPASVTGGSRTAIAIAPDGQRLAFIGRTGDVSRLYVRALASDTCVPYPGTEGAESPVFSPDGRWIAFWSGGNLMKVPAAGGPVTPICNLDSVDPPLGMSWGDDGQIVFSRLRGGLMRVSADGGVPAALTTLASDEVSHRLPHVLPGSRWVLFTSRRTAWLWGSEQIVAQSLVTAERKIVLQGGSDARYVPTGHLVYLRRGTLCARAFDLAKVSVAGAEYGLIEKVAHSVEAISEWNVTGSGQFAVSATGTLIYLHGDVPPPARSELLVLDRGGHASVIPTEASSFVIAPTLSPDGETVAVPSRDRDGFGLWLVNVRRGTKTRSLSEGEIFWPVWRPDGRGIAFLWRAGGTAAVGWMAVDSTAPPERLVTMAAEASVAPLTWSPDGRRLVVNVLQPDGSRDIDVVSLDDRGGVLQPLIHTPANEINAALSRDGKWLLYASNETGRSEVYLQAYPAAGARIAVSTAGGMNPAWSPTGDELFYVSEPGKDAKRWLMSVSFRSLPTLSVGVPRALFEFPAHAKPRGPSLRRVSRRRTFHDVPATARAAAGPGDRDHAGRSLVRGTQGEGARRQVGVPAHGSPRAVAAPGVNKVKPGSVRRRTPESRFAQRRAQR